MKERKLSPRAIDELCRLLYAPLIHRPLTPQTPKEQKRDAARIAAFHLGRLQLQPPDEKREFEQEVWLVLKLLLEEKERVTLLLGQPFDEEEKGQGEEPPTLQSEKLHRRWWTVAGLHKKQGWSWDRSYKAASYIWRNTPYAGSPLTMKQAYVTVNYIRRAIKREREAEAKRAAKELPAPA
jgi:hypothetical protein